MSILAKLTSSGQVTIPKTIRQKLNAQPGDLLGIQVDGDGRIILTPIKLIDASQAYYWTEEWQKGERQADADIKAGRVKRFDSAVEAVKYLESLG